jgi:C1q domain
MSNRLGGKQGTAYTGTNANQPPNWTFSNRDPNQYDIQNVSLGDLWMNQDNETVWVLVSLEGDMASKGSLATWSKIDNGGGTGILDTLTGDSGGAITPDGLSNINFASGIAGLSFDGDAGTNTITLNSDGSIVQTLTANSGGVVSPALGNINIVGDGVGINIVGNPGTNTLTASLVGGGGGAVESFDTDSGMANPTGGVININAQSTAGSSVRFTGATDTIKLKVTDGGLNTIVGFGSGNLTQTGLSNVVFGSGSGGALTSGSNNTIVGTTAALLLTSGDDNVCIGTNSGDFLTTGSKNVFVGEASGYAYNGDESSNICIGAETLGTLGESNTLRIGNATGTGDGQLNKSFIAGIRGITPGVDDGIPVVIDSNGQLGTEGSAGTGQAFSTYLTNTYLIPDSTFVQIAYDTLPYNRGTGFNLGTSTFTASVAGLYNFSCVVGYKFTGVSATGYSTLVTTNYQYFVINILYTDITRSPIEPVQTVLGNSVDVKMDMGDTAYLGTFVTAGVGGSNLIGTVPQICNYFCGYLI